MHIVHSLHEGGIERLLLELCKKIDKDRFEMQVCCLVELGSLALEFESYGVKIHLLNAKRNFSIKNIFINTYKIFELAKLLRHERIDITHGHEFFSTVFSRFSSIISGVKYRYITLHNMYFWWNWKIHFTQRILSYLTTQIVCNSFSTLNYSLKTDKIKPTKYQVIMNGIDCQNFQKKDLNKEVFLNKYGLSSKNFICMNVGNISFRKGQEYLIRAASLLKNDFPDMVYFLIGGKYHQEPEEFNRINALIGSLKMDNKIFITGRMNCIQDILNFCDLYVMPSTVEGFGLSLAEAMSMGNIAIASDIAPFKEIIDDNIDGYLFKSSDYSDLAMLIKSVREKESNVLTGIKINARKKILNKFNSEKMAKEYESMYLNNISKKHV